MEHCTPETGGLKSHCRKFAKRLDCKDKVYDFLKFAGVAIGRDNETISLTQEDKAKHLAEMNKNASFSEYNFCIMELGRPVQSRPNIAGVTSLMAQLFETAYSTSMLEHVTKLNKCIRELKETTLCGRQFKEMDSDTSHVQVNTDGSFGNVMDHRSQIGDAVFFCEESGSARTLLSILSLTRARG